MTKKADRIGFQGHAIWRDGRASLGGGRNLDYIKEGRSTPDV